MLTRYKPYQYYVCKSPCRNVTFSTLPETTEALTETLTCSCCGRQIRFSTVTLPESVSHPVSRRKWGERTDIFSVVLKITEETWQSLPFSKVKNFATLENHDG